MGYCVGVGVYFFVIYFYLILTHNTFNIIVHVDFRTHSVTVSIWFSETLQGQRFTKKRI